METVEQRVVAVIQERSGQLEEQGRDDAWINKRFSVWQTGYREGVAAKSTLKPEIEIAGSVAQLLEDCSDDYDSSDVIVLESTVNDVKTDSAKSQVKHEALQIPGICEQAQIESESEENKPTIIVVAAETEAAQVMKQIGREPKTSAELMHYGMAYCEVWMETRISQMISTQDCTEVFRLQEEAKVFIQSLVRNLKEEFKDLDTGTIFSVFEAWAEEFVVNTMEDKRQKAIQVLNYVHKTFSNRYNQSDTIQSQLTYELVTQCGAVEEACAYFLKNVMMDDQHELTIIQRMGGVMFYEKLKSKRALTYLKCLNRVLLFEAKMEGEMEDAVCFPHDPALEGTSYDLENSLEPLKFEEELGPEVIQILQKKVGDMFETVRCKLAEVHQKRIQNETEVVAKAVKYVKERHDKALEAKTVKLAQDDIVMLKQVHEEQVKLHVETFKNVKGFVYTDLWNLEELEAELYELYGKWEKQMVAKIAQRAQEFILLRPFAVVSQITPSPEMDEKPRITVSTEIAGGSNGGLDEQRQSRRSSTRSKACHTKGRQRISSSKGLRKEYSRRRSTSRIRSDTPEARRGSDKDRLRRSASKSKNTENDRSDRRKSSSSSRNSKKQRCPSSSKGSSKIPEKRRSSEKESKSPPSDSTHKASPKNSKIVYGDSEKLTKDTPSAAKPPPKTSDDVGALFSDISDAEEDFPKASVDTVQPRNMSYTGCGVAIMLADDGVSHEGIGEKVQTWNQNIRIKDPASPEEATLISVKDLLTSMEPRTKESINFKGAHQACKFYNEEILALHFRRIALNLEKEKVQKPSLQQALVFAAPTTTSSNARLRLKNAAILGGVSNPMFVQTTTAIAVGALALYPKPNGTQIITVYVQNGLIDVAVCKVVDGKSVALKTGNCQKKFVIDEGSLPDIIKDAKALIDELTKSVMSMSPPEILKVKACFLVLNLPLVLIDKDKFFDPLVRLFHMELKAHLPGVEIYPHYRKLIIDGALLISKEAAEYNQSRLYSEVCPWTVYLDGGDGIKTREMLLKANTQVDDAVVMRVKRDQLGNILAVRRKVTGQQVFIHGLDECKKTFSDPSAYIDIECSPQGLIEVKPCDMWEEIVAPQRCYMPMRAQFVREAKRRIEQLFPAFLSPQQEQRHVSTVKRLSLGSRQGEVPGKKVRV